MIAKEAFMDIVALFRQGHSMRSISEKLGLHRKTVKKYILCQRFPEYRRKAPRPSILAPFARIINDWLSQDNYRASWIFGRLKSMGYSGGYDTVKHFVRTIKQQQARIAYSRFETLPGLQAQMDWADFKIHEACGRVTTVYLFVLILGYCRALYAELVRRCTLETFLDCHIRAFEYLGGVPAEILYDNMKHVVTRRGGGQVEFNIEFMHFAHHYGFKPRACPPYGPWVKGKVERPVDYIRESFWRGYEFGAIPNANGDLRQWLDTVANRRVHGTHHQPVGERWQQERGHLGPLPAAGYDTSLKIYRKVYKDCLISYDTNCYQLPHRVVGKKVLLKIKGGLIRFFDDDRLLASYPLAEGKHQTIGNSLFTEQLRADRLQQRRKYGRSKGQATRGLSDGSLFPQVMYRPLADYERLAQGGAAWIN
jgi:transposase